MGPGPYQRTCWRFLGRTAPTNLDGSKRSVGKPGLFDLAGSKPLKHRDWGICCKHVCAVIPACFFSKSHSAIFCLFVISGSFGVTSCV